jgi:DNA-binding transcriptional LysR family regulator
MTFDQLKIFVAVAERQHLTRAAAALGLTPSAVSASIKVLEGYYNVRLFERVGRGIELTPAGRTFLGEAKATLARVRSAESVLNDLGGLRRGSIDIHASQTIANYWLPSRLMRFHELYPDIEMRLTVGNTKTVSQAVIDGSAELGFIEGKVDVPALSMEPVTQDDLVIVVASGHPMAGRTDLSIFAILSRLDWVVREPGSGTRSEFEEALKTLSVDPAELRIVLTLPSNEAVLTAVRSGQCAAALSKVVVEPFVENRQLAVLQFPLPPRNFTVLRHKERHFSAAANQLTIMCGNTDFAA